MFTNIDNNVPVTKDVVTGERRVLVVSAGGSQPRRVLRAHPERHSNY